MAYTIIASRKGLIVWLEIPTNISIRMDADLKAGGRLFTELGMNLTTAFNILAS